VTGNRNASAEAGVRRCKRDVSYPT